ncbi:MAG: hypothetical protein LBN07_01500 [Christensenellaceae bacterium]|jgi:hypothetical protein|nr:hypothetical protein [Christensenellaceae bacterium]
METKVPNKKVRKEPIIVENKEAIEQGITIDLKARKNKIWQWLYFAINILTWIIIVFILSAALSMYISNKKTGLPAVFGLVIVQIASGSMVDAGFEVGSHALIRQVSFDSLEVGDYIAFRYFVTAGASAPGDVSPTHKPLQEAPRGTKIIFHEIKEIITDVNGQRWFITKGTNNAAEDPFPIYENYVIGRHVDISRTAENFLSFIFSPIGTMVVVTLPATLIMGFDIYTVIIVGVELRENKRKKKSDEREKI